MLDSGQVVRVQKGDTHHTGQTGKDIRDTHLEVTGTVIMKVTIDMMLAVMEASRRVAIGAGRLHTSMRT